MDLPPHLQQLWQTAQHLDSRGSRPQRKAALDQFIDALLQWPRWREWSLHLAERAIDHNAPGRIRFPLFQRALYPALTEAVQARHPGSCRWLAGFEELLYQIPGETPTSYELLELSLLHDPADQHSLVIKLDACRSGFRWLFHELPYAIPGNPFDDQALLQELEEFRLLSDRLGGPPSDASFIEQARSFVQLYRGYLDERSFERGFPAYLRERVHPLRFTDEAQATPRAPISQRWLWNR